MPSQVAIAWPHDISVMVKLTLFFALLTAALISQLTNLSGLVFISALFQAASVANIHLSPADITGSSAYGITLFNSAALVAAIALLSKLVSRPNLPLRANLRLPLSLLVAYASIAVVGGVTLPLLFEGLPVHLQIKMNGANEPPVPLRWSLSNLAQCVNLLILLAVLLYFVLAVRTQEEKRKLITAIVVGSGIVASISLYEQAAHLFSWPSMATLLANNPGYSIAPLNWSEGSPVVRVGLPFSESSYASVFLASVTVGGFAVALLGRGRWWAWLGSVVSGLALVNTFGATGIFAAAAGVAAVFCWACVRATKSSGSPIRTRVVVASLAFITVCSAGVVAYQTSPWQPQIRSMAVGLVLHKLVQQDGVREQSNRRALEVFSESYGLGVGLGSNRASSFLASMLSNTGLAGFCLFFLMLFALAREYWRADALTDIQVFSISAIAASTLAMSIGVPDLNLPMYWCFIFLGFVFCPEPNVHLGV